MTAATLDDWIADASVRTVHRRSAAAAPAALWDAAGQVRLADTRRLGRMVRWRIPGLDGSLRYRQMFREYPFVVLEESEHGLVSGLCGKIWTLTRDYPRLAGADEFAAWDEPGTVRVAFAHWVSPLDHGGGSEIVSEARVEPVDMRARLRLKTIWAVLGPFAPLVASEPLALAVRRAEGA
ncbi:hypothetical protein [Candidatus Solirubrobacter pratensis]|uniref:hypothetical protein n=1 Tax=Candidatus Solirubrobacter pratensis TaxID=1298857 RepID=UPI0004025F7A|nr:hypothetical protein [Candidatus Solirubrobacter pratensis]